MTTFHLRPVSRDGMVSSPSPSTSTASDRTSPSHRGSHRPRTDIASPQAANAQRPRRPLSPLPLRDVDLSTNNNATLRKYPAPPTGHELMALFPPAPPVNMFAGPTSGFFLAEERAFFAKGGNEMVRVRIEVDMPRDGEPDPVAKPKPRDSAPRQWSSPIPPPNAQPHSPQPSPHDSIPPPLGPPLPNTMRTPRNGAVTVTTQPVFPIVSHGASPAPFPQHLHSPPSVPHPNFPMRDHHLASVGGPMEGEELRDDPDEAWRRPMPHNQRRRAGKHTKRVVVK